MTPMQLVDIEIKDMRTITNLLEDHITMMETKTLLSRIYRRLSR